MNTRLVSLLLVVLVVLSVVLSLTACQQDKESSEDSATMEDPSYIVGSGLYRRHCQGCHGDHGEGRTSLGPQINTEEWQSGITDEQIREVILSGRRAAGTSMDGFEGVFSDDEIDAIIVFVRALEE